jgi:hypothetical protein
MELDLWKWLKLLASHDPTPAGGSLALATLAGAAALASKCARLSGASHAGYDGFASDFQNFAGQDCEIYSALTSDDEAKIRHAILESLGHAQAALEFLELSSASKVYFKPVLLPDLNAALTLAATSANILLDNLEANLQLGVIAPQPLIDQLAEFRDRLTKASASKTI